MTKNGFSLLIILLAIDLGHLINLHPPDVVRHAQLQLVDQLIGLTFDFGSSCCGPTPASSVRLKIGIYIYETQSTRPSWVLLPSKFNVRSQLSLNVRETKKMVVIGKVLNIIKPKNPES